MKTYTWLTVIMAVLALAVAGCGKKEATVDTAQLESSFSQADTQTQSSANKAVVAIQSGEYSNALAELQKLAGQAKLTPEQQQAIKDTIEQVKTVMAQAAKEATEGAQQAVGDLQKSLTK